MRNSVKNAQVGVRILTLLCDMMWLDVVKTTVSWTRTSMRIVSSCLQRSEDVMTDDSCLLSLPQLWFENIAMTLAMNHYNMLWFENNMPFVFVVIATIIHFITRNHDSWLLS